NSDCSLQVVYDPQTGSPDGTGRQPFASNVIPEDRMSPAARQLLEFYPTTNTGGANEISRNYLRQNDTKVDRHNTDVKINWNRTAAHQIWGKYSQMDANVSNLFYLGVDGNGSGDTKVYQATFGQTWTLTPTLVLDSTFGFSRQDQQVLSSDFETGFFGRDVLGLPGTNGGSGAFADDERYAGFPEFNTGFSTLGNDDTWSPLFRDERTYAIAANLTKMAGDHELRFGYSGNYVYLDHWQPERGNPRGSFEFAENATALNGGQTPNEYNTYAAFLLGLVSESGKSVQNELLTAREWQHALYLNDRWQLNDRMTLNLGLRYEYYPLMTRADRGIETLDLETMEVVLGGLGGNPKDVGVSVSSGLFAPRLGFIYRLNDDTVFRSGYGVTYNPLPFARPLRDPFPLTIAGSFTQENEWGWVSRLDEGIPEIVGPDPSTGRVALPPDVLMRFPESDVSRGNIQSWNVAIERRLPADISLDLAYVGTKGTDGFAVLDINASQTPGGGDESRPFFDEFGRNIALHSWGPRLTTEYHGLQVAINRPFRNGLLLKGAYTWSKSMGESPDGEDDQDSLFWNAPSQYDRNYALQQFDRTHVFQLGFLYELPFANNTTGLVKALADGWQVNGIFYAYTGLPFTVSASGDISINMPGNQQTADQLAEPEKLGNIGDDGPYYDPSAWAQPEGVRFGNTGRNSVRGPGGWNTDLSVFRSFPLGGTRRLEARIEAFNVFNHPVFTRPGTTHSLTEDTFMQIFNTDVGPRAVRLGLRFSF
ncbi:MAG: TonB-dependent receptor domain-containing protein, partial [Vicinamibacteraceae bacterium]